MSASGYLHLVYGVLPAAFLCDLAVVGAVALWWRLKKVKP